MYLDKSHVVLNVDDLYYDVRGQFTQNDLCAASIWKGQTLEPISAQRVEQLARLNSGFIFGHYTTFEQAMEICEGAVDDFLEDLTWLRTLLAPPIQRNCPDNLLIEAVYHQWGMTNHRFPLEDRRRFT
jgi:hypothetical protein